MSEETINPQENALMCDPDSGVCEMPGTEGLAQTIVETQPSDKIKVVYFTDPICSSCWGIEPQLRKLKLEYGTELQFEYHMGGLLPDWSYNSGGISKPSDVASHWDEVSPHYDMPIDGDVWLEDPLDSSYPPSIAFKAAQQQDEKKALLFLRKIREMVFLQKKNITKWEHLAEAAAAVGLDVEQLKQDYEGSAQTQFQEDLALSKQYGVRGFPTIFVLDQDGNRRVVYGSRAYAEYEAALRNINPEIEKQDYDHSWEGLFSKHSSLTAREFAELSDTPRDQAEATLNALVDEGKLTRFDTKNGAIWFVTEG